MHRVNVIMPVEVTAEGGGHVEGEMTSEDGDDVGE